MSDIPIGYRSQLLLSLREAAGDDPAMSKMLLGAADEIEELALWAATKDAELARLREQVRVLRAACKSALRLRGAANQEGEHWERRGTAPPKLQAVCDAIENQLRDAVKATEE